MSGLHKGLNKIFVENVENVPSYMFDRVLSVPRVINMLGLEYTKFMNMARLHQVLCKLYFKD